jgi:hypothetical protein
MVVATPVAGSPCRLVSVLLVVGRRESSIARIVESKKSGAGAIRQQLRSKGRQVENIVIDPFTGDLRLPRIRTRSHGLSFDFFGPRNSNPLPFVNRGELLRAISVPGVDDSS